MRPPAKRRDASAAEPATPQPPPPVRDPMRTPASSAGRQDNTHDNVNQRAHARFDNSPKPRTRPTSRLTTQAPSEMPFGRVRSSLGDVTRSPRHARHACPPSSAHERARRRGIRHEPGRHGRRARLAPFRLSRQARTTTTSACRGTQPRHANGSSRRSAAERSTRQSDPSPRTVVADAIRSSRASRRHRGGM